MGPPRSGRGVKPRGNEKLILRGKPSRSAALTVCVVARMSPRVGREWNVAAS